jgi:hypothetical protein
MRSLFAKAVERLTGYKARSDFRAPIVVEMDEREIRALDHSHLNEIKLSFSVLYRAYRHDRACERQAAERCLRTELYRDALAAIDRAVHAASDGDRDATIRILLTLRQEIVG